MQFQPPINGVSKAMSPDQQPPMTTAYMQNVFPVDTLERRVRLGQRPGLERMYTQQIGGAANPIVAICKITVVDV